MRVESTANAFDQINRAFQMLNELNQTIVDKTQDLQDKAVRYSVENQVGSGSHIDLQA